jgi:hypothetical protein
VFRHNPIGIQCGIFGAGVVTAHFRCQTVPNSAIYHSVFGIRSSDYNPLHNLLSPNSLTHNHMS